MFQRAYPKALVTSLDKNIKQLSIWLLVIALVYCRLVIFLIDNTIRLAMFSNRFLDQNMQMVGATRWLLQNLLT
jgi:cell division transport system permease protein